MAKNRPKRPDGRPTKAVMAKYGKLPDDYHIHLFKAAVEASVNGEKFVYIRLHRLMKLPKSFPNHQRFYESVDYNIHRVRVYFLMKWLYDEGLSPTSTIEFGEFKKQMTNMIKEIENGY